MTPGNLGFPAQLSSQRRGGLARHVAGGLSYVAGGLSHVAGRPAHVAGQRATSLAGGPREIGGKLSGQWRRLSGRARYICEMGYPLSEFDDRFNNASGAEPRRPDRRARWSQSGLHARFAASNRKEELSRARRTVSPEW